jgi:murein DD-endopeptidase MepM/ murein hydrolase activator NlpD
MQSLLKFIIICFFSLFLFSSCAQVNDIFKPKPQVAPSVKKKIQKQEEEKKQQLKKQEEEDEKNVEIVDTSSIREPIVTRKGTYYYVSEGDSLSIISKKYKISKEDLAQINDLFTTDLIVGRRLFIPHKRYRRNYLSMTALIKEQKGSIVHSKHKVRFIWPVKKYILTSPFGMRRGRHHDGIDLSVKRGTEVHAAEEGVVLYAKRFTSYGNLIVIKHANGYYTGYAHLSKFKVKPGKEVKKDQVIAIAGKTGRVKAKAALLHFEVHRNNAMLNPVKVLPKN